jgi:hypothetical protein
MHLYSDLDIMKDYYEIIMLIRLGFNSYLKKRKPWFHKGRQSIFLTFNPERTSIKGKSKFSCSRPNKSSCLHSFRLGNRGKMITAIPKVCWYVMVLISKRDGLGQPKWINLL